MGTALHDNRENVKRGSKLLTRCFGLKHKASIIAAILALDLVGILINTREGKSTKFLNRVLVLSTRDPDENSTAKALVVLLIPFFGCRLCW